MNATCELCELNGPTHLNLNEDAACDATLVREIAEARCDKALGELYQRHRALLAGVVRRVLCDDSMVDDVLQDVFVQVWEHADKYDPEKGQVLGWLVVLARRRALDRVRQRYSYQKATDRFEMEQERQASEGAANCSVEQEACSADLRDLIFTVIDTLPRAQQSVILLTYFNQMSQRQVASELGVPLGTVKTRIELGMRKLSNALTLMREKVT